MSSDRAAAGSTWVSVLLVEGVVEEELGSFWSGKRRRRRWCLVPAQAQVPVLLGEGLLLHSCNNKYKQRMIQELNNSWQSQDKTVAQV